MNYFITATDTGVGKTIVSAVLLDYLSQQDPYYYKPVQSGAIKQNDHWISEDIKIVNELTNSEFTTQGSCSYLLKAFMSPYQAAKKENKVIDIDHILKYYEQLKSIYKCIFVEGAGGLHVPLTEQHCIIDLISLMSISVIIVVRPDLGTINHSLLSIEALKSRDIPITGFIVNRYPHQPDTVQIENPLMIEQYGGVPCIGVIKDDPDPLNHYQLDLPGT